MNARKLLLSVLLGGPILGTLAGLAVDTTMQPAAEPSWRKVKPDVIFTSAGKQFVEAGPEDLDPARIARSTLLARRFAADADERGGRHGYSQYRVEPPAPLPEPEEAALPAEAAGKAPAALVPAEPTAVELPDGPAAAIML